MRTITRNFIYALIFISGVHCNGKKDKLPELTNADIMGVVGRMTELMVHDITNPPLAARFFSYACLSGYEIIAQNDSAFHSMQGVLNEYPVLSGTDSVSGYSYQVAAVLAMLETAKKMQPSGSRLQAYQSAFMDSCIKIGFDENTISQSLKYAQAISKIILGYAKADRYTKISNLARYTPLQGDAYWYPTPPAYIAAIEPYFNTVRPFMLDSAAQFKPMPPVEYSTEKNSPFFKMLEANAKESETSLSAEHRLIAAYWDCNPFAVQDGGHLLVGLKKISPGAHWLGITGVACRDAKKSFNESMFLHTIVAVGLMDSFLACWDEKFRSNRVRPETAIRRQIDPHWKPLLQTPPFPEYLSGHSCISATSATLLTHFIGDNIAFTDTVEVRFGLPERKFSSFKQAANEAAISRFYGGIHFMDAIENGLTQGRQVGEMMIGKLAQVKGQR